MSVLNDLLKVPIAFGLITGLSIMVTVELVKWMYKTTLLQRMWSVLLETSSLPKATSLQKARAYTVLVKNGYCTKHLIPKVVADYARDGGYRIECTRCAEEQEARAKDRKLAKARRVTEAIEAIRDINCSWAVVDTDNFGGDYPNEKFMATGLTKQEAEDRATFLNRGHNGYSSRWYKIVPQPYTLQPGFEA